MPSRQRALQTLYRGPSTHYSRLPLSNASASYQSMGGAVFLSGCRASRPREDESTGLMFWTDLDEFLSHEIGTRATRKRGRYVRSLEQTATPVRPDLHQLRCIGQRPRGDAYSINTHKTAEAQIVLRAVRSADVAAISGWHAA